MSSVLPSSVIVQPDLYQTWSEPLKTGFLMQELITYSRSDEMSLVVRKPVFAYAKTKTQISFAVTAKLISAFVFPTRIVQSLYFLNTKFQASSHLMRLCSPVSVGPGRKSRRPVFSRRGSVNAQSFVTTASKLTNSHALQRRHALQGQSMRS